MKKDGIAEIKEQYINDLRKGQLYSIGKFDDQILYICSGALVLSLNFIKDIVPLPEASYLWLLYFSWWVMITTIVLSLSSHLYSYYLTERQIKRVEKDEILKDDKSIIALNYLMAIFLTLGIVFQILFVTININIMSENKKIIKTIVPQSKPNGIEELGLPVQSSPTSLKPPPIPSDSSTKK